MTISALKVEAILCVWEQWVTRRDMDDDITLMFEQHGTCAMRQHSITVGQWADETFESWCNFKPGNRDRLDVPYDWEIIPAILSTLRFNPLHGGVIYPTTVTVFDALEELAIKNGAKPLEPTWPVGTRVSIEHDGFTGDVIGHYETHEGKKGVVLQQDGSRVVHVYGEKWLK